MKNRSVDFLPFEKKDKYHILVVEDKKDHQIAAELQLGDHKYKIAENYTEAINYLNQVVEIGNRPDVVLTDMFMPFGYNPVTTDRTKESPLGYSFALYAARQSIAVPRIAILSDLDHHANAISATFDDFNYKGKDLEEFYFKTKENHSVKVATRINNSFLGMFDVGDFMPGWLLDNKIYSFEELQEQNINLFAPTRVKNWNAALESIINGPTSCI